MQSPALHECKSDAVDQAHGLRECALGGAGGQPRVPQWLEKWTALILAFIEEEQSQLPDQLLSLRLPAPSFAPLYTQAGAILEAKGALPAPLLQILIMPIS